jgi:hypothetical protein
MIAKKDIVLEHIFIKEIDVCIKRQWCYFSELNLNSEVYDKDRTYAAATYGRAYA